MPQQIVSAMRNVTTAAVMPPCHPKKGKVTRSTIGSAQSQSISDKTIVVS
jgi:hypothetical protein